MLITYTKNQVQKFGTLIQVINKNTHAMESVGSSKIFICNRAATSMGIPVV